MDVPNTAVFRLREQLTEQQELEQQLLSSSLKLSSCGSWTCESLTLLELLQVQKQLERQQQVLGFFFPFRPAHLP